MGYNPNEPRDAEGKWTDAGDAIRAAASDLHSDAEKYKSILHSDRDLKGNKIEETEQEFDTTLRLYKWKSIDDIPNDITSVSPNSVGREIANKFGTGAHVANTGSTYFGIYALDKNDEIKTITVRISDHDSYAQSKADYDLSFNLSGDLLKRGKTDPKDIIPNIKEFYKKNSLRLISDKYLAIKYGSEDHEIGDFGKAEARYKTLINQGYVHKNDIIKIIESAKIKIPEWLK